MSRGRLERLAEDLMELGADTAMNVGVGQPGRAMRMRSQLRWADTGAAIFDTLESLR